MTRETKINLVFLAVILALMLPGAFFMFAKRVYDYERPSMAMPTPMRIDAVYIDPQPRHPSVERFVPPRILTWHRKVLARQFDQLPPMEGGRWAQLEARASTYRNFELLGVAQRPDTTYIYVLLWDPTLLPRLSSSLFEVEVADARELEKANWQAASASIDAASPQPLPFEIDRELRNLGYVDPPDAVMLLRLKTEQPLGQPGAIRVTLDDRPAEKLPDGPNAASGSIGWKPWEGKTTLDMLHNRQAAETSSATDD